MPRLPTGFYVSTRFVAFQRVEEDKRQLCGTPIGAGRASRSAHSEGKPGAQILLLTGFEAWCIFALDRVFGTPHRRSWRVAQLTSTLRVSRHGHVSAWKEVGLDTLRTSHTSDSRSLQNRVTWVSNLYPTL